MKNSISLEEFKLLPAGSYQLIDIRGEEEIAHGAIRAQLRSHRMHF